jgi:nucleotide-binding universal stress UspA family protein
MNPKRIVIGVDFSDASGDASRWAAQYFAPGAEVVLAHVIALPHAPPILRGRFPRREPLMETLRDGAEHRLRELSLSLASERIWIEVREGEPAETLASIAEAYSADVVVCGTHGARAGFEGLGSTAEHLVEVSHVPVLLVARARNAPPMQIAVAVDDTEMAMHALARAGELSQASGAQVTAIHVAAAPIATSALAAAATVAGAPQVDAPARLYALAANEPGPWLARAVQAGIPSDRANGEVAFGDPPGEIVGAAERLAADLLIMGRRRAGGVRRAVLGSVVNGVLRRAPCPVLVLVEPTATAS